MAAAAARLALRTTSSRTTPRILSRSASAVPAAAQNLPPVSPTEDPQLAGLQYPKVLEVNRQLRPAKRGWWDEQDRWNKGEPVAENEDVLSMWGPDQHPHFPGSQAASYLGVAALAMAGIAYFIYASKPERPLIARTYPDGLKVDLTGKADSELPGARSNSLREGGESEDDE